MGFNLIIQNWFYQPHSSGFLVFLIGGWAILALYHLLLYIQNRNSLYLLYGLYLLAIIGYQLHFLHKSYPFLKEPPFLSIIRHPEFFTEISYLIYFLFAFRFLKIAEEFPKWYFYLKRAIIIVALYCTITLLINIFKFNLASANSYYLIFVVYILILSIITYVMFFKSKHPLRYYIIVGSLILSIFSVLSLAFTIIYASNGNYPEWAFSFLYIGYILETIIFALGLGHLQFRIYRERNRSQEQFIEQLKENAKLRQINQVKLEKDVAILSKKSEMGKIENLKMRYEMELTELKVSALRSQMNPHFIFNSLNSIKRYIIDNEQENAVYYLNKFSKLIRKILSSSMESTISLAEEIEIATLYVNIENIRFNNEIYFDLQLDKNINIETLKVPSMILQPFLENAIWHGLSLTTDNRKLVLEIKKLKNNHIFIAIIDNGIGRKKAQELKARKIHKRQSFGIALTKERLQNFSENLVENSSIEFIDLYDEDQRSIGTRAEILIPII